MDLARILAKRTGPAETAPPANFVPAFTFLGNTDDVTTCDCCGRQELKSTVALEDEHGNVVYFGVVCAANALKIPAKEVRVRAKAADDAKAAAKRAEVEAARQIEMKRWRTFLVEATGGIRDFKGDLDIFRMIEKLGGHDATRTAYKDWIARRS